MNSDSDSIDPKAPSQSSYGVLNSLTEEQKEQIIEWLETRPYREVREMIGAPAPKGFGIQTHTTSLVRFHRRYQARLDAELKQDSAELLPELNANTAETEKLVEAAVRQIALQVSMDPAKRIDRFPTLCRWLFKLKQIEQRERELKIMEARLALRREEFEFSAARNALWHLPELNKIAANPDMDNDDKIMASGDLLFERQSRQGDSESHQKPSQHKSFKEEYELRKNKANPTPAES